MSRDDRQLLLATHAGDEPAARALWARHAPRLTAYANSILPRWLSGEDLVQGVMCSILSLPRRELAGVQDGAAFLTRLVRNAALNAVRAARRERARLNALTVRPAATGGTGDDDLRAAVDCLPRRLREVVVLKHVAGMTFDQISLSLGTNRNTVASRYREALARLRRCLGAEQRALESCCLDHAEVGHG